MGKYHRESASRDGIEIDDIYRSWSTEMRKIVSVLEFNVAYKTGTSLDHPIRSYVTDVEFYFPPI